MRIKIKPQDFRVEELLREDCLEARGEHRVYGVTKRKVTSLDAARVLARLAGASSPGEVAMAGLKDRQGVTRQYMSVRRGKTVDHSDQNLSIETVGFARAPLSSRDSLGNAFELVARDLDDRELRRLRAALPSVREHGLPNYFDDQRFGNLRHNQGWLALELVRGRADRALKRLLTAVSDHDDKRTRSFKSALYRHWGKWRECREIAGRFGTHHSVFAHLKRHPEDCAGAFRHVATRIRLIHLFAWQSHLWNRALALHLGRVTPREQSFTYRIREGKLVFPKGRVDLPAPWEGALPLPGARLEGVELPDQRTLFEEVLDQHDLTPAGLAIEGVEGFALKAEPRVATVVPGELRARPAEPDRVHPGRKLVKLSFRLPRGAYATLLLSRLFGPPRSH